MSSCLSFVLLALVAIAFTEGRSIPTESDSPTMVLLGNSPVYHRNKRSPVGQYPHRAMMFTGYYRPQRRSHEGQVAGVYAQGNAVSGGSYLGDHQQPDYLQRGPEPVDDSEVSSAEAEAAPNPLDHHVDEEDQHDFTILKDQEQQHPKDSRPSQNEDPSSIVPTEQTFAEQPEKAPKRPTKKQGSKKSKKTPVVVESDESNESDEIDDEDEDEDDEPIVPFIPFRKNRRQGNVPNLNNFFPMVFNYPRGISRSSSSPDESSPGMITAIANSYSTSKGGVASAVAKAYGGSSPQGKKLRRTQPVQE